MRGEVLVSERVGELLRGGEPVGGELFQRAATASATFCGTAFRSFVTGAASSVTIFMMICCAEAPVCGGFPVSISYSTLPSE